MQHPKEFMNMVLASFVTFTLVVFLAGITSFLAFGKDLQSPLTMNGGIAGQSFVETQLQFVAKVLLVFTVLSAYIVKQSDIFISFFRLKESMFGSAEESFDLNLKPNPEYQTVNHFLKCIFLGFVVFLSCKVPQNPNALMTISGGLFVMILIGLFPIVIFNKTLG